MRKEHIPEVSQDIFYKALGSMPMPLEGTIDFIADGIKRRSGNDSHQYNVDCKAAGVVPYSRLFLRYEQDTGWFSKSTYYDQQTRDSVDMSKRMTPHEEPEFITSGTLDVLLKPHRTEQITIELQPSSGGILWGSTRKNYPDYGFKVLQERTLPALRTGGYHVNSAEINLDSDANNNHFLDSSAKLSIYSFSGPKIKGVEPFRKGLTLDYGRDPDSEDLKQLKKWFEGLKNPKEAGTRNTGVEFIVFNAPYPF